MTKPGRAVPCPVAAPTLIFPSSHPVFYVSAVTPAQIPAASSQPTRTCAAMEAAERVLQLKAGCTPSERSSTSRAAATVTHSECCTSLRNSSKGRDAHKGFWLVAASAQPSLLLSTAAAAAMIASGSAAAVALEHHLFLLLLSCLKACTEAGATFDGDALQLR
jgi:hypothetical protein